MESSKSIDMHPDDIVLAEFVGLREITSVFPMTSKTKTNRRAFTKASSGVLLGSLLPEIVLAENVEGVDICVYGATASGIAAAIGAVGCGRECVVSRWRLGRAVSHLA